VGYRQHRRVPYDYGNTAYVRSHIMNLDTLTSRLWDAYDAMIHSGEPMSRERFKAAMHDVVAGEMAKANAEVQTDPFDGLVVPSSKQRVIRGIEALSQAHPMLRKIIEKQEPWRTDPWTHKAPLGAVVTITGLQRLQHGPIPGQWMTIAANPHDDRITLRRIA
jgi:hypothetical protein